MGDISLLLESCTPKGKTQIQYIEKMKEQKRIDELIKENEEIGEKNRKFVQCITRAQIKFNHDIESQVKEGKGK